MGWDQVLATRVHTAIEQVTHIAHCFHSKGNED